MNEIDNEKAILEETPDFDDQLKILEEEEKESKKRKKHYRFMLTIILFIVLMLGVSYARIYTYHEFKGGEKTNSNCEYVNLKVNGSLVPNLNVTDDGSCVPKYNIDYNHSNMAIFNVDINNDRSILYNKMNQMDSTGTYCVLNCDSNGDGWPDYNIDMTGDGIADFNVVSDPKKAYEDIQNGKTPTCDKNCDTDGDGWPDDKIDPSTTPNGIGVDKDFDGICDVNCDTNFDRKPDINIDTDNDTIADVNIDFDHDGKADFNIDTNGDNKPDVNLDPYGNGICVFNCKDANGNITNPVTNATGGAACSRNCDTDGDGWPDTNVDINNDWQCDFNCNNGTTNIDKNHNYILDETEPKVGSAQITDGTSEDFYIINSLDINASDVEPGWNGKFVITVTNDTSNVVKYDLLWQDVTNTFVETIPEYSIFKDNMSFIEKKVLPSEGTIVKKDLLIRPKTSIKYMLDITWENKNYNQIADSGKSFKGKFNVEVNK